MQLKHFSGSEQAPRYAILSHTWGTEHDEPEVLFQDWDLAIQDEFRDAMKRLDVVSGWPPKKKGRKLAGFCGKARSLGLEWGWVDTLCIDKRSSAELSEAINSMWNLYSHAAVCLAYISDFDETEISANFHGYYRPRWFTRGWTLQELLAPSSLLFFNSRWELLGTRSTLAHEVASLTDLPENILKHGYHSKKSECCVAERLSWASDRITTRGEDRAYSLMGLFGVNMPVLYGEGYENAFYRLQIEILQATGDYSILAWEGPPHTSLLAESLEFFGVHQRNPGIKQIPNYKWYWDQIPHIETPRFGVRSHVQGLKLQLAMLPVDSHGLPVKENPPSHYIAFLPFTAHPPTTVSAADMIHPPSFTLTLVTTSNTQNDFERLLTSDKRKTDQIKLRDMLSHFPGDGIFPVGFGIRDVYVPYSFESIIWTVTAKASNSGTAPGGIFSVKDSLVSIPPPILPADSQTSVSPPARGYLSLQRFFPFHSIVSSPELDPTATFQPIRCSGAVSYPDIGIYGELGYGPVNRCSNFRIMILGIPDWDNTQYFSGIWISIFVGRQGCQSRPTNELDVNDPIIKESYIRARYRDPGFEEADEDGMWCVKLRADDSRFKILNFAGAGGPPGCLAVTVKTREPDTNEGYGQLGCEIEVNYVE